MSTNIFTAIFQFVLMVCSFNAFVRTPSRDSKHRYTGRQDVCCKSYFVHIEDQSKFSAHHFQFQTNLWI